MSEETITIPIIPPQRLLESMALRANHAYGLSIGYSDEEIEGIRKESPVFAMQLMTKRQREVLLAEMAQIHEEVVGRGFYRYE